MLVTPETHKHCLSFCETVCSLTLQFLFFTNFRLFLSILSNSKGSYLYCSRTLVMVSFQSQESLEELFVYKGFGDEQHVAKGFRCDLSLNSHLSACVPNLKIYLPLKWRA